MTTDKSESGGHSIEDKTTEFSQKGGANSDFYNQKSRSSGLT
jgi:hypothetical protein